MPKLSFFEDTMETEKWVTGKIKLRIHGEPLEMEMTVPAFNIKPQRMLPVFQEMSSSIVGISVDAIESEGGKISCKAGCGACCRQAVPISEVEAYQIAEIVNGLAEPKRSQVKQRFSDALAHFRKINWFDELIGLQDMSYEGTPGFTPERYMETVMKYFREGIPCPFLDEESCSIHPVRPLICREYLVTSPAENCGSPSAETIRKVPIVMKPSRAMLGVGRTENTDGISSLMLIEALDFVERYPENFEEKTGEQWAADFFNCLLQPTTPGPPGPPKTGSKPRRKKRRK